MSASIDSKLNNNCNNLKIVIHGGAGVIFHDDNNNETNSYIQSMKWILTQSYKYVRSKSDISAVDIVEFTVKLLEDEPLFNAGVGSVFTTDETHELEASIMDGATLSCGSVSLVKSINNPISLARIIMDKTNHNYIVGSKAEEIGVKYGLTQVSPSFFSTGKRLKQLIEAKESNVVKNDHGTVGCVCCYNSNVAAATSTGGMTNKLSGRIGDSPIIGAGTYANNKTCAVSATGKGEEFMRHVVAYDISARVEYSQLSLAESVRKTVFDKLPAQSGGVIVVNCHGEDAVEFNSVGMYRGVIDSSGNGYVAIWEEKILFSISDFQDL